MLSGRDRGSDTEGLIGTGLSSKYWLDSLLVDDNKACLSKLVCRYCADKTSSAEFFFGEVEISLSCKTFLEVSVICLGVSA